MCCWLGSYLWSFVVWAPNLRLLRFSENWERERERERERKEKKTSEFSSSFFLLAERELQHRSARRGDTAKEKGGGGIFQKRKGNLYLFERLIGSRSSDFAFEALLVAFPPSNHLNFFARRYRIPTTFNTASPTYSGYTSINNKPFNISSLFAERGKRCAFASLGFGVPALFVTFGGQSSVKGRRWGLVAGGAHPSD